MRIAAFIVVTLLLAGCGGAKNRLDRLDSGAVVLAFGDSLTFGTGAGPGESYPAILERRIGLKVVNAGVPGEISAQGLARLPEVLDEVKPRLLILCHGGNDFLRRMSEAEAAGNLRSMIELAREKGVGVVLLATPKPGLPPSVPKFYGAIAAEMKVPYEESVIHRVLLDQKLKSDMVHPNAKGYAEIADAVKKVLERSGAI